MKTETLKSQVKRLAEFIMQECKGYPNQSEGAIDCAIRIIKDLKVFASQNPERVIAYEFYCPSTGHYYVDYIHRSDIEAPGQEYMQRPLGYLSDLCSGSQEKEQGNKNYRSDEKKGNRRKN